MKEPIEELIPCGSTDRDMCILYSWINKLRKECADLQEQIGKLSDEMNEYDD